MRRVIIIALLGWMLSSVTVRGQMLVGSGGVVVVLGGEEAAAAVEACKGFTIQFLCRSPQTVKQLREQFLTEEGYGRVSVRRYDGETLPYNDNLVNVVFVNESERVSENEILRILVPGGTAFVESQGEWKELVKEVPKEIDDWPCSLYSADGNAVSRDTAVGPPEHLQWFAEPRFGRHHEHMSSVSAVVSAGGRLFSIVDEGSNYSIMLPSDWKLIARDAYNGSVLWKRRIPQWHPRYFPMKNGPSVLGHRIVATDSVVLATLGLNAPISVLDAVTGKNPRVLEATENTHEFVLDGDIVYAVCTVDNESTIAYERQHDDSVAVKERNRVFKTHYRKGPRLIKAVKYDTGELLWSRKSPVQTLSLAVQGDRAVYHNDECVVCLDTESGSEAWRSEQVGAGHKYMFGRGANMVIHDDVVLYSTTEKTVHAFSLEDGKTLWEASRPRTGHRSAQDLFVIDDRVWYGETASGRQKGIFTSRDLHTGKVLSEFAPDVNPYWFHHRCHRARATENYLIVSRTGIELIDFRDQKWYPNHWVRGACAYGLIPANGMIYAPTHPCACYLSAKLQYFNALAPASRMSYEQPEGDSGARRTKGPAFDRNIDSAAIAEDWPQYRCDVARSGYTSTKVGKGLQRKWRVMVGGEPGRIVVAEGRAFVPVPERHTLYALDAATGKPCWHFVAGGRIDSPPAVVDGRVIFGSRDGYVYCVAASDGAEIWRYRAARQQRQMMALQQLESAHPVHGSVLVRDGKVYCTAGRSRFLDGGISLLVLDAVTGQLVSEHVLDETGPDGKDLHTKVQGLSMPVALSDILSCNGKYIFMHSQPFGLDGKPVVGAGDEDLKHLFTPTGFLDDSWFHRTYWLYGTSFNSGWNHWYDKGRVRPAGRLLVHHDGKVFGYGRKPTYYRWSTPLDYHLFCVDDDPKLKSSGDGQQDGAPSRRKAGYMTQADWKQFHWSREIPLVVRAMVLADETLFVAGPPDLLNEEKAWRKIDRVPDDSAVNGQWKALQGGKGGMLWAVSAGEGDKVAGMNIDSVPVYDGMAAAEGRLYVALLDGSVICLE